jgi:hypothetical protein
MRIILHPVLLTFMAVLANVFEVKPHIFTWSLLLAILLDIKGWYERFKKWEAEQEDRDK